MNLLRVHSALFLLLKAPYILVGMLILFKMVFFTKTINP